MDVLQQGKEETGWNEMSRDAAQLKEEIRHLKEYKKVLLKDISKLQGVRNKKNALALQKEILEKNFLGQSPYHLLDHYDRSIRARQAQLHQLRPAFLQSSSLRLAIPVLFVMALVIGALILVRPQITGLVISEPGGFAFELNQTFNESTNITWQPATNKTITSILANAHILGSKSARLSIISQAERITIFEYNLTSNLSSTVLERLSEVQNITNKSADGIIPSLEYAGDSSWDKNNDGIESGKGVIDFSVNKTAFEFNATNDSLCTLWDIHNLEEDEISRICFGSAQCCSFANLAPVENTRWNDPLYLHAGRHGAGVANRVYATVISYSEQSQARVSPRLWLKADFSMNEIEIQQECMQSCLMNLSPHNLTLEIELESAVLHLDDLIYTLGEQTQPPEPKVKVNIPSQIAQRNTPLYIDIRDYAQGIQSLKKFNASLLNASARLNVSNTTLRLTFNETGKQNVSITLAIGNQSLNTTFEVMVRPLLNLTRAQIGQDVLDELEEKSSARVIVKLKQGLPKHFGSAKFGSLHSPQTLQGVQVGKINPYDLEALAANPDVEQITLDRPVELLLNESLNLINATLSDFNMTLTGAGTSICIVDSGLNYSLPELDNYMYGYDFVDNDSLPLDGHGHGTSVAVIASRTAPGASILAARVINSSGGGYESDVLAGVAWCMNQSPDIISLSIGAGAYQGYCDSNIVASRVNDAVAQGILVVAATGNDGSDKLKAPSCAMNATRVASSTNSDEIASFSNVNSIVDLLAPGQGIMVSDINGDLTQKSGTSLSAPMAAGAAALLMENETLSPFELKDRLRSTGIPISYDCCTNISRIDVFNAIMNITTNTPANYTANQTQGQDSEYEVSLTENLYTHTDCGHIAIYNCSKIDNLTVDEDYIIQAEIRFKVCRGGGPSCNGDGSAFDGDAQIKIENSTGGVQTHTERFSSNSWVNSCGDYYSEWYNVTDTVRYSGSYGIEMCDPGSGGGNVYGAEVQLNVTGYDCDTDDLDSHQTACETCGNTWIDADSAYSDCCGDDSAAEDTWNSTTRVCCGGSELTGGTNRFCSQNNEWWASGSGFCGDSNGVFFHGTSNTSTLNCSVCTYNEIGNNYICDESTTDGIIDGICGMNLSDEIACIGTAAWNSSLGVYDENLSRYMGEECDSDTTDGYTANGIVVNDTTQPSYVCHSGNTCYDNEGGIYYDGYAACDYDSDIDTSGDPCDSDTTTSFGIEGMVVNGPACASGTVYINSSDNNKFYAGCTNQTFEACDDAISLTNSPYSTNGVCVDYECDTQEVCRFGITQMSDCNLCGDNRECDQITSDGDYDNTYGLCCNDDCIEDGSLNPGATCCHDNNCESGNCTDNICKGADGDDCIAGTDCASGFCREGLCKSDGCFRNVQGERCSDDSNSYLSTLGGVCAYPGFSTWECDKDEVANGINIQYEYYNDCSFTDTSVANPCDDDIGINGIGYSAYGICVSDADACDTNEVCFDGSNYRNNCSNCYSSGAEAIECDTDVDNFGYSASGICVSGGSCVNGACYKDSDTTYYSSCDSCSNTESDSDVCDTGTSDGEFNAGGLCALWSIGDARCVTGTVCAADNGVLWQTCASAACNDGTSCDSSAANSDTGFDQDGRCAGTTCCTSTYVEGGLCDACTAGNDGLQCDTTPTDEIYDGVCTDAATPTCCTTNASSDGSDYFCDSCSSGLHCDSAIASSGYSRDGYCASGSCCTTLISSGETTSATWDDGDESCSCDRSASICDSTPSTGPSATGVCASNSCATGTVCYDGADYLNGVGGCSANDSCDSNVVGPSVRYFRDGYVCSGSCIVDNSATDGETCCRDENCNGDLLCVSGTCQVAEPVVHEVVITPAMPDSQENLTCNVTATDVNNATFYIEWAWYKNGELNLTGNATSVANGTNTAITNLSFANTSKGDLWNCTVRGWDGAYGVYNSTALTILNYPPDDPSVNLTTQLQTNLTTQDLNCSANLTDLDGDTLNVTVRWYKDNVLNDTYIFNNSYASGSFFNMTLESGNTTVREVWQCSIQTNDGVNVSNESYSPSMTIRDPSAADITWEDPTPEPDEQVFRNHVYLNTTITDDSDTAAFFNWNGTLEGYWSMETRTASDVSDDSGNSRDAAFAGSAGQDSMSEGKFGDSLELNGTTGYLSLDGSAGSFQPYAYGTIMMWLYMKSDDNTQVPFSISDQSDASSDLAFYTEGSDASTLYFYIREGGSYLSGADYNTISLSYSDDEWMHVAVVQDGSMIRLYKNGVLQDSEASNAWIRNVTEIDAMRIGNRADSSGNEHFFNGSIDEVAVFSRALTASEILASFDNSNNRLESNLTNLANGSYSYSAYAIDEAGNIQTTASRTVNVILNALPWAENIRFDPQPVYTNDTLNCSVDVYDNDSSSLTVEFTWYNLSGDGSSWNLYSAFNASTSNDTTVNYTLNPAGLQDRNETWNCTVRVIDDYNSSGYFSNSTYINNSAPLKVNLIYPEDGDEFFTNLTPNFNWTNSTDSDNDTLTYRIQVASDESFETIIFDVFEIETSNYTWSNDLPFFTTYYWRVQANDSMAVSEWSNTSNFTLEPDVTISLVSTSMDFGMMDLGEENDTTNDTPEPFKIQNDGNKLANISINASTLWLESSAGLNTSYFQFKSRNSTEYGSFNWSASVQDWANMSSETTLCIAQLNHSDESDFAYVDIRVASPMDEIPGAKNSTILFQSRES